MCCLSKESFTGCSPQNMCVLCFTLLFLSLSVDFRRQQHIFCKVDRKPPLPFRIFFLFRCHDSRRAARGGSLLIK